MPTYEYLCSKCGHTFDKSQPIAAEPLTICEKELCGLKKWGKGKVKRAIVAGGGLIFKGSGFYITDYRSEKYKEAAKKDSSGAVPSAPAGGDSKTGGDSKSSAPAPAKVESKPAKAKSSDDKQ